MENPVLKFILQWADNAMILGQRLSEWCGHGPQLEQDIAITNISLDLIGEARNLYQYAAEIEGNNKSEDDYPFMRKEASFYNILLVEQPNKDWAYTIVRQFMFDTFHYYFLEAMTKSNDARLAAIASKSVKESRYHLKYSTDWMLRLGDGTEVSHLKVQEALHIMIKFYEECFIPSEEELALVKSGIAVDLQHVSVKAREEFERVVTESTLKLPQTNIKRTGGKQGQHSEHLGYILATMQYIPRTYPNLQW